MRRQVGSHVPEDFPCKKEKALSLKCLSENNFDHDKCQHAFLNFKTCRSFWKHICTLRQRSNVKPELPPPDEREQILKDFKASGKLPIYSNAEDVHMGR